MMNAVRKLVRLLIEEVHLGLLDRYQDAIDSAGNAAEEYGWTTFDYEEVGPATILITFERMDRTQPQAPQRRSITDGDLSALQDAVRKGWGDVGKSIENVTGKDSGAARVDIVVVVPGRTGEMKWEIP